MLLQLHQAAASKSLLAACQAPGFQGEEAEKV